MDSSADTRWKPQRIRDPLHDLIEFKQSEQFEGILWQVVQTQTFQRLRRIKQLGFSDFVYPGATHSRFAHSLGVFHTARQLMDVVRRYEGRRLETHEEYALAAALVHDVGHGPFSHAFEEVGKRLGYKFAHHAAISDALIRNGEIANILNQYGAGFAQDVADMVSDDGQKTVHKAVVSSQFDADRLDYIRRDRLMTGTHHSAIDFTWLLANLEVAEIAIGQDGKKEGSVNTFVIGPKAVCAAEAYILGLFQLYQTVYFHKATRGAELLFTELLVRLIKLVREGNAKKTGLPGNHPLVRFAKAPDNLETMLLLDDTVVWGALSMMSDAKDPLISSFSLRLQWRNLYKCCDIRTHVAHALAPKSTHDAIAIESINVCCTRVIEKLKEQSSSAENDEPSILVDQGHRSPYKSSNESSGPTERINVRTDGGELIDLKRCSPLVAGLSDFVFYRAYFRKGDKNAEEIIMRTIEEEVAACHKEIQ